MPLPVVVIVGRPNVGKSSLFNALVRRRVSIVEPTPGVTRDCVTARVTYDDREYEVWDTGGLGLVDEQHLEADVEAQVAVALEEADAVIFLVDAREGLQPLDARVAERLRRLSTPLVLAANKAETQELRDGAGEFAEFGFGTALPISAEQRQGLRALMDAVAAGLPVGTAALGPAPGERAQSLAPTEPHAPAEPPPPLGGGCAHPRVGVGGAERGRGVRAPTRSPAPTDSQAAGAEEAPGAAGGVPAEAAPIRVAIVGRRNAGKSTLVNRLLGAERMIVGALPGTTRDAVDCALEFEDTRFTLIDTAGMRRKKALADSIGFYAQARAERALRSAHVAVLLLDCTTDISNVDQHLARLVAAAATPTIIALNKWDLAAPRGLTKEAYRAYVDQELSGLSFAPRLCVSGADGTNVADLLRQARALHRQAGVRIATAELNRVLHDAAGRQLPRCGPAKKPKVLYGAQVEVHPPTIIVTVNDTRLFSAQYGRYLAQRFRAVFPWKDIPLRVFFRGR